MSNKPQTDDEVLEQMLQALSQAHDKLNEQQAKLTMIGMGDTSRIAELQAAKNKLIGKMDGIIEKLCSR